MSTDPHSFYDMVVALGLAFMVIVFPTWTIFRYLGLRAMARAAGRGDPAASQTLLDQARRLESRIEYLERVLDSEMPGWRTRA